MKHAIINSIKGSTFFQGLSSEACRELAELTQTKEFRKRDIIFSENTKGELIYLLTEGAIQLQKTTMEGNEIVIRTVKPGEVFAEVILFEQDRYPVTAVAISHSTTYCFNRRDMLALLDHAEFRDDFIKNLMKKMRYLAERVRYLTSYDVEQRFFMFLRDHYGEHEMINPDISKKDLAAAIGSTPETFSRLTKRLQDSGALDWKGGELRIPAATWDRF